MEEMKKGRREARGEEISGKKKENKKENNKCMTRCSLNIFERKSLPASNLYAAKNFCL
jgi:hypothetical protein